MSVICPHPLGIRRETSLPFRRSGHILNLTAGADPQRDVSGGGRPENPTGTTPGEQSVLQEDDTRARLSYGNICNCTIRPWPNHRHSRAFDTPWWKSASFTIGIGLLPTHATPSPNCQRPPDSLSCSHVTALALITTTNCSLSILHLTVSDTIYLGVLTERGHQGPP